MSSADKMAVIIAALVMLSWMVVASIEAVGKSHAAEACFKAGHTVQECREHRW